MNGGGDVSLKTSSKGDRPLCTTKKQKFVGFKEFLDTSTNEVVPMQVIQVEDRDFNFHKVWLKNLIMSLDDISNQRLKLAFWILDHLDSENKLVMTQRAISQKSGMSMNTVIRTMKALQSGRPAFLQKINSGAYRVNPNVIWKGSFDKRMGICFNYGREDQDEVRNEAREADPSIAEVEAQEEAYWEAQEENLPEEEEAED